jgi:hypothetical protein
VLSRFAQTGRNIQIGRSLDRRIDILDDDKRAPVPDQVAANTDVGVWWNAFTKGMKMKQIVRDLIAAEISLRSAIRFCR